MESCREAARIANGGPGSQLAAGRFAEVQWERSDTVDQEIEGVKEGEKPIWEVCGCKGCEKWYVSRRKLAGWFGQGEEGNEGKYS